MALAFAFPNPFAPLFNPIVNGLTTVLLGIHHFIPSLGWSLIVLAFLVRLVFWPLLQMQAKSMAEMQKVQPLVKALQAKHKGDPQALNAEMMALYKEHNVNPFASCLPLLLQLPILMGLYWAIISQRAMFTTEHWGWIGTPISAAFPKILAQNLGSPDYLLLALYVVSMYFSVRFGSPPAADPQQAQQQKLMAFVSPLIIAFIGQKWPSALILYWLAINLFTTAQQIFLYRRMGLIGPKAAVLATATAGGVKNVTPPRNGTTAKTARNGTAEIDGAKRRRPRRS